MGLDKLNECKTDHVYEFRSIIQERDDELKQSIIAGPKIRVARTKSYSIHVCARCYKVRKELI